MPKKPKIADDELKDTWADDQEKREYYYDDSHGYEEYDPDEPEDETESVTTDTSPPLEPSP